MDKVCIQDIQTEAVIGVYEFEQEAPQPLIIDLELTTDFSAAFRSDDLNDALDYDDITQQVRAFCEDSCYALLEALAGGIIELLFDTQPININKVAVRIRKPKALKKRHGSGLLRANQGADVTYCVIGIGSNEKPDYHCRLMIEALRQVFGDIRVSQLHRTSALGVKAPDYINAVVIFESDVTYTALKGWCRALEKRLGRVRGQIQCCADLDILYFSETELTHTLLADVDEYYKEGVKQLLGSDR